MAANNVWKQFQSLLPTRPRFIAKVVEIDGTRSKVELRNGGVMWVDGASVAIGARALVVDGMVQSEAKPLSHSEVFLR